MTFALYDNSFLQNGLNIASIFTSRCVYCILLALVKSQIFEKHIVFGKNQTAMAHIFSKYQTNPRKHKHIYSKDVFVCEWSWHRNTAC